MKSTLPKALSLSCLLTFTALQPANAAGVDGLSLVKSKADLEAFLASTSDAKLKQAVTNNASRILSAAAQRPHIQAVIQTLESSPGKLEKINTTPDDLKAAGGTELPLFETLRLVDLAMPNAGPHDQRKTDPFTQEFFAHLGEIEALESLNIIATKASDDWIAPLAKLKNLKTLRFTNNGKLTDAGLEQLASLKQLESFAFVGTGMKGHAFSKFEGWTNLKQSSFRGSSIDDEGLQLLCERFPNYESLSLAHAKFTDAGAPHLAKLTKLKGLELGTRNASPQCLKHLAGLPLEYLQLGDGLDAPEGIAAIKDMKSLRRLTLTNSKGLTDADLKTVAGMSFLESLEFSNLEITEERLPQLKAFAFLKALRLVQRPQAYPAELQNKLKTLLPNVALKFD